ncbi:hypothetical protein GXP67_28040 [Rhodocytophaga rosea]|uniref:Uncharacterized protein n=1 Tax=Rhodocytophaga rosea TaxID=2704465 RepID=A0A6C0GQU1_9BACT|nr:hypothetical protein [Rhodocytophaga rosea]QHT70224.1 hypothetical protein GXP67_28040 [Rhodocytophaga rosea]
MCYCVYVGSNQTLPLIEQGPYSRAFYVTPVREDEKEVEGHFTKKHVYYLGSYTGCSCGFNYNPNATPLAPPGVEPIESIYALLSYLKEALEYEHDIEFYTCWAGNQAQLPDQRVAVAIEEITDISDGFYLDENIFVTITK